MARGPTEGEAVIIIIIIYYVAKVIWRELH